MFFSYINEPIDVIRQLLENSDDNIIGIRIPSGDLYFTVDGFQSYMKPFLTSEVDHDRLDLRGPFADNFEATANGKPHRNIYYIGRGNAIVDKMRAHVDSKEGTSMEKAAGMFKAVLHSYPVYTFRPMHAAVIDETAHKKLK